MRCSCLLHARIVGARCPSFAANSWDTRYPGAPRHLLHASAHFPFASVSQSSYRNRNTAVAPLSLSLPWHPFPFYHGDKCFIMLLSTFNKNCIKLAHVIHIMITTPSMFKLLFALITKCTWGFTGFVVCYIWPHLNCLDGIVLLCIIS